MDKSVDRSCASAVDPEAATTGGAAQPGVRRSRVGSRRAWVLLAVHVAIAAHIAHWKLTGETLSPVEPSEAIELSKRGVINAGAIFFGLAIVATALFGRFFCGWACHIVALQDACRWLLERLGLRPRPVQLGVLGLVPWIVFVYMFLAPLAFRALNDYDLLHFETELTTNLFWQTFPGWTMALTTFVVCGFIVVYFLGAKGFCTYGCPYGAIFGIADQLAPVRIRVTDACEGCGHCTSVCTSNVRVHQEVRDWKQVVDPGCMKCLDCVSVCPKDALYVGFGAPALVAKRTRPSARQGAWGRRIARAAIASLFLWAAMLVLLWHDLGELQLGFAAQLAIGATLVGVVFAGRAERSGGPTPGEELLLAAAFLVGLFAFRGYQPFPWTDGGVPLLLALGLAGLFAYGALLALRLLRRSNVSLQSHALRVTGRWTRAGVTFAVAALPFLAWSGHAGWTRVRRDVDRASARRAERERSDQVAAARAAFERGVAHASAGRVEAALGEFEGALALDAEFLEARENLAGMYCAVGRFADGIAQYRIALERNPLDADTHFLLGRAYAATDDLRRAEEHWSEALRLRPDHAPSHEALAILCEERGDASGARRHREAARQVRTPLER